MNKIKIIIFGCSKRAKEIERICENILEIDIVGYTDNNEEIWGDVYLGRPVYSIESFIKKCKEDESILVLPSIYAYDTILNQLEQLDINNKYYSSLYAILDEYNLFEKYRKEIMINQEIEEKESEFLLIVNEGLPREGNLYRSGFVFRRLKAYREAGIKVDALGFFDTQMIEFYQHENELIIEGRENALTYLLKRHKYKKIMVHFMFPEIMRLLKTYAPNTDIICWIHGYEILSWRRRLFNFSQQEIEASKEIRDQAFEKKKLFWNSLFAHENMKFVFVSEWLKDIAKQDIGNLPQFHFIIPNYIDTKFYSYKKKSEVDVYKILAIKSNKSRVYANDLICKTIRVLSERKIFSKLSFEVYGDGSLFEENYEELVKLDYPNVHIYKTYLTQTEIASLHKLNGVFLCPTRQDTQGVSMCEAMSSGMVVITNRIAAIPEYINETCGILCDYENAEQMADAIEYLINKRLEFLELSKKAAEYMEERCGYRKTIAKEIDLICR